MNSTPPTGSALFDIAIVGSGFGGSLMAMIARKLGYSVLLLERHRHPRFAIGESSTPLANLLLEELAQHYHLPQLLPLTQWGSWQKQYPQIGCGLKRGFTFFHHALDHPFAGRADRQDQLLVAASPHDEVADTHWFREEFDHFLVQEAQALGVHYLDEVHLQTVAMDAAKVILEGSRHRQSCRFQARFLIDASASRGFLHQALQLPESSTVPKTQALFSHFVGVKPLADLGIISSADTPPYPVDAAAVHHVFEGGWVWVLQFNNGITSAGVAAQEPFAKALQFEAGAPAWERLLQRLPTLQQQFASATAIRPFSHLSRMAFRSQTIVGARWAMLPSAAGFVDPLLSTGFPLTLLGIERLARLLASDWDTPQLPDQLAVYAHQTRQDLDAAEQLVQALYASMGHFPTFVDLSLLYFCAASFTETARRLGKPELAGSFLMQDHPHFGPRLRQCCAEAQRLAGKQFNPIQAQELRQRIYQAMEAYNIAGLGRPERANWYPMLTQDLFEAGHKLGASPAELQQMLERCGL